MTCLLLTWNPARWEWKSLADELRVSLLGQPVYREWSVGNRNHVAIGTRVFLLKQGKPPRGILASGHTCGPVVERAHWDPERSARGETARFVPVAFDRIVAPEAVLSVDDLNTGTLATINWHPQSGGYEVPAASVPELERRWAQYVLPRVPNAMPEEPTPIMRYVEGAPYQVLVNRYERDPDARKQCLAAHGTRCAVCGFSFEERYGTIGQGFIHVHHLSPLHEGGDREVHPVRDLRPVCANCHAMLHRKEPPYGIDELRQMLRPAAPPA